MSTHVLMIAGVIAVVFVLWLTVAVPLIARLVIAIEHGRVPPLRRRSSF